jgi:hypothetical protein
VTLTPQAETLTTPEEVELRGCGVMADQEVLEMLVLEMLAVAVDPLRETLEEMEFLVLVLNINQLPHLYSQPLGLFLGQLTFLVLAAVALTRWLE